MPNGVTHTKFLTAGLFVVLPSSFYAWFLYPTIAPWVTVGYICGFIIDPDMDQVGITKAEGRILAISKIPVIGLVIAWTWLAFWLGYGITMKHRGILSHGLLISTAIRILYMVFVSVGVLSLTHWDYWIPSIVQYLIEHWREAAGWTAGLLIADTIHILMDLLERWVLSLMKRWGYNGGKKRKNNRRR